MDGLLNNILASSIVVGVFFLILLGIYYFISFKNIKRNREFFSKLHQDLKPGVRVEFSGGLTGRIVKVTEDYCDIEIAKDLVITVSRYGISKII